MYRCIYLWFPLGRNRVVKTYITRVYDVIRWCWCSSFRGNRKNIAQIFKKKRNNEGKVGGGHTQYIALAVGCALVVALTGGTLVLFYTEAMWEMDSPNAQSWNATLNCTSTFGGWGPIIIVIVLIVGVSLSMMFTRLGFG